MNCVWIEIPVIIRVVCRGVGHWGWTVPRVVIHYHLSDGLVVALHHPDRMWTSGVQVVDITRKWYRDHVIATPEAAQLLVFYLVSHVEGCDRLVGFHIPQLAGLVAGSGEEALVVCTPGDSVDSTRMSIFTLRLEFSDLEWEIIFFNCRLNPPYVLVVQTVLVVQWNLDIRTSISGFTRYTDENSSDYRISRLRD
jgi:hypothetical protein